MYSITRVALYILPLNHSGSLLTTTIAEVVFVVGVVVVVNFYNHVFVWREFLVFSCEQLHIIVDFKKQNHVKIVIGCVIDSARNVCSFLPFFFSQRKWKSSQTVGTVVFDDEARDVVLAVVAVSLDTCVRFVDGLICTHSSRVTCSFHWKLNRSSLPRVLG